jgi:hypothetical protein
MMSFSLLGKTNKQLRVRYGKGSWGKNKKIGRSSRLTVAYRMYKKRFPGTPLDGKTIEQVPPDPFSPACGKVPILMRVLGRV